MKKFIVFTAILENFIAITHWLNRRDLTDKNIVVF